jgi:hypothetical protein
MVSGKIFGLAPIRITISSEVISACRNSLLAWIVVRIVQFLTGFAVGQESNLVRTQYSFYYHGLIPLTSGWQGVLFGIWQRWDGIYYQLIAEKGYSADYLSVFFPFYPLLGHWISALTGISALIALLLVSNVTFIGLLVLLNLLANDLFDQEIGRRTVIGAAIFPTAFFFSAIYPQSLALFLILLSYYSFRKKHWALSAFAAFLAGLTHSTVLPLALLLAVEVFQRFRQHNKFQRIALGCIPFLPLIGTALFMTWRIRFGYPNYQQLEMSGWGVGFMTPWQFVNSLVTYTIADRYNLIYMMSIAIFIIACIVTVWSFRKLPLSLSIYQLSTLIFITFTGILTKPLSSISRFVLIMFPIFFFIGFQTQKKLIRIGVIELCVILQILLTVFFFQWGFVA